MECRIIAHPRVLAATILAIVQLKIRGQIARALCHVEKGVRDLYGARAIVLDPNFDEEGNGAPEVADVIVCTVLSRRQSAKGTVPFPDFSQLARGGLDG